MPITEPSGQSVFSPKLLNQSVVRKFVGQGGYGYVSIAIVDNARAAATPDTISLQVWFNDVSQHQPPTNPWGVQVATATAEQLNTEGVGMYWYDIGPTLTQDRGLLTAVWTYTLGGQQFTAVQNMQILNPMPVYDGLADPEKLTVEQVTWMLGDLFDSTDGGAWLGENFQTHFDYERLAQLYGIAVQRMNLTGFPVTYYEAGQRNNGVPANFSGLMIFGTYLEAVRHLRDSYVEIPLFQQMNVTYADRRDYMGRWGQVLSEQEPDYQRMIKYAKRKLLSLGRGSMLVAGGIYGGNALGLFQVGTYACLHPDTLVQTDHGLQPIGDLIGRLDVKLIGDRGQLVTAEVRSFGEQQLWALTVARGEKKMKILATADHRWFRPDMTEIVTSSLCAEDELRTLSGSNWSVQSVERTDDMSEVCCAHVPDGGAFCLSEALLTGNSQTRSWRFYPAAPQLGFQSTGVKY